MSKHTNKAWEFIKPLARYENLYNLCVDMNTQHVSMAARGQKGRICISRDLCHL